MAKLSASETLSAASITVRSRIAGGWLEPIWRIDPAKREAFARLGQWGIVVLAAVGTACALSSVGLWRGKRWGYYLALSMLIINGLSDVAGGLLHDPKTLIGAPIAAALVYYLYTRRSKFTGAVAREPRSSSAS